MKNWKMVLFIIVATAAIVIFLSSCAKKRECINARENAGNAHAQLEAAYYTMMDNPTNYTITKFKEAEIRDSVAVSIMKRTCEKCKSCN